MKRQPGTNGFLQTRSGRWGGLLLAGVLLGIGSPGYPVPLVGIGALALLLWMLEQPAASWQAQLRTSFLSCWLVGGVGALLAAHWITNSAHVFGGLPLPVAWLVTGVGYGLEAGVLLWVALALPLLGTRFRTIRGLPFRLLWAIGVDAFWPRLIHWNLGSLSLSGLPVVEQMADVWGAPGMGVLSLGTALVLLEVFRWQQGQQPLKALVAPALVLALAWGGAWAYGSWRLADLSTSEPAPEVQVVTLQPNFSLRQLASNPDLAHSDREANLQALLADSRQALEASPPFEGPRLLVWPESVYPGALFKDAAPLQRVRAFLREQQVFLMVASIDWERRDGRWRFHGISALLGPNGQELGRYRKVFLIPFGEMIPFSDWFPGAAAWLREQIPNMSEFEPGTEFTVFPLAGEAVAGPICFDIFAPETLRRLSQNGARFAVNLSNLAWFGKTTASDNMEAILRWRAIENRLPVLLASNNGKSVFLEVTGRPQSERLGLFTEGALVETIPLRSYDSIYRDQREAVALVWLVLLIASGLGGLLNRSPQEP